jgi:hypothetical protein
MNTLTLILEPDVAPRGVVPVSRQAKVDAASGSLVQSTLVQVPWLFEDRSDSTRRLQETLRRRRVERAELQTVFDLVPGWTSSSFDVTAAAAHWDEVSGPSRHAVIFRSRRHALAAQAEQLARSPYFTVRGVALSIDLAEELQSSHVCSGVC